MHHDFYKHAEYYDIAFSYRDVKGEVDFLLALSERYGRPPRAALELACGPGYHALELARRGVQATGLDLAADMVRILSEKAKAAKLDVHGVVGDMKSFRVPGRFDLAFNLLTSISYLLTDDDLDAHFATVAQHLEKGGLYVVENNHPKDFFEGEHFKESRWTMTRDGVSVDTSWMCEPPAKSWVQQRYRVKARYVVDDHGKQIVLEDAAWLRMLLPLEMSRHAAKHGLRLVGSYGDWRFDQPLDDSEASWRNLAVYVKDG